MRDEKLFIDISGLRDLRDQEPAALSLVARAFQEVILPLNPDLPLIGIVLFNDSGTSKRVAQFVAREWEQWYRDLGKNRKRASAIYLVYANEALRFTSRATERLALGVGLESSPDSFGLTSFTFSVAIDLVTQSQYPNVQNALVGMAKEAFALYNAPVGYITRDKLVAKPNGGVDSPYELSTGISHEWASKDFSHQARGYYWGNFLTAGHIEALGGLDKVLAEAPCARAEVLDPNGKSVYLQLTNSLEEIPLDRLRALRDYLRPILRPGEQTSWVTHFRLVENPEAEFWDTAEPSNVRAQSKPPNTALPHPEEQTPHSNSGHEAREWLTNKNPSALACNRFSYTQEALAFVEGLYQLGAVKVSVIRDVAKPFGVAQDGGPYADALAIILPDDPAQRQELFSVASAEAYMEGLNSPRDTGQREIVLWWD